MTAAANDNTDFLCEDMSVLREIVEKQRTELAALRTLLINERALRERAESKLRDLLRRLYGPKARSSRTSSSRCSGSPTFRRSRCLRRR